MQPACAGNELKRLKAEVIAIAGARAPDQAWRLIETLVCGDGKAAERYMLSHMPAMISTGAKDEPAAEERPRLVPRSIEVMARKQAWDASVVEANGNVRVLFWTNEACVGSADIRPQAGDWLLVIAATACD